MDIAGLLDQNTGEVQSVLRALNGEYILPEAGGDLLRDGAGALPTGVPSPVPPLSLLPLTRTGAGWQSRRIVDRIQPSAHVLLMWQDRC